MISKKTMVALVVGSVFAVPTYAQILWLGDGIRTQNGVIEATNKDLVGGLAASSTPGVLKITTFGGTSDGPGKASLTLTNTKHEFTQLRFLSNSGLKTTKRQNILSLDSTSLSLTGGIVFENASYMVPIADKDTTVNFQVNNSVNLTNQSILNGDIIHYYSRPQGYKPKSNWYFINSNRSVAKIDLLDGSKWNGDLRDVISKNETPDSSVIYEDNVNGEYVVSLKNGSSWTGGVDIAKNSTAEVTLDGTSSWTVNKDSKVNSIQFENVATRKTAEKNGVAIADGVTLTVADGSKSSTINALHTGAGSTLAVEKANVTLNNFAGKGDIVLNKDGKVEVKAASDKVNTTFTSLEGSKFVANDKVNANVTVAGALVDEKGMDAVIKQFNDNKNYEGKGLITFSGGMVADDVFGINDKGQFVQTGTTKNAQLVSIGESTAITMMQWRADADDMYQRMGDLRNNNGSVGVWARTFGGKAEAGHVDNKYYGVQAGVDTQVATTGPKQFVGGAVSYTTGDATFANGTGDNYMGTFTGYSTWLFDNGSYVDVAAKVGKLNNEFDLAVEGKKLAGKYSTQAVALTVESGHRFPVTNLTYVEPQVAFTASHIFGEDYGATNGVTIEQDSINSYVARVGVQAGLNCPDNMGSVFVRASYLYDFDGETSTVARNAKETNRFDQDFGGGWYELGLGMNVNFTKNLYGYADFEYVTGGEIKTPYRWNAGVRYAF